MSTSLPPRPPLPALGLPRAPRRLGPGALVAHVAHVVVIGAVIWERTRYLESAVGGAGPRGGGGGGEQLQYVALAQAAEAPKQKAVPPPVETPVPVPEPIVLPDPRVEITPISITPVAVAITGIETGTGGPGSGTGSGGGTGSGTGPYDGPGSGGGDGGDIIPPDPIGIFIPPDCIAGTIAVTFSVEATGRVSRVELNPPPKESSCRRELTDKLRLYKFKPARTRDGIAVASKFNGSVGK